MAEHSPTPWRNAMPNWNGRSIIQDAIGAIVTTDTREADAAFIVEAVNAIDATLKLERTLLGWSMERDRLHDLVRRLANMAETTLPDAMENWRGFTSGRVEFEREAYALIREAREALGEAAQ